MRRKWHLDTWQMEDMIDEIKAAEYRRCLRKGNELVILRAWLGCREAQAAVPDYYKPKYRPEGVTRRAWHSGWYNKRIAVSILEAYDPNALAVIVKVFGIIHYDTWRVWGEKTARDYVINSLSPRSLEPLLQYYKIKEVECLRS